MQKIVKNESGSVLLVTLAIISVLIAVALHFGKTTGQSVLFAIHYNDAFIARQKALSGIALARLMLIEDAFTTKVDSVQEAWADPHMVEQAVASLGFKKGTLTVKIEDELGKIPVNALIRWYPGFELSSDHWDVLERFFNLKIKSDEAFYSRDSAVIMNSLKDWLDSMDDDAVSGLSGAENDYYSDLPIPYVCQNGPVNTVQTLLRIKGMIGIEDVNPGSFFTVYGIAGEKRTGTKFYYSGKININTAGHDVIAALLPDGLEDMAPELIDYRSQRQENEQIFTNTLDKRWVEKVIDLSEKEKNRINRLVTYSSNIFKIVCHAAENDTKITMTAFVKRAKNIISGKWICKVIQMEQN